MPQLELVSPFSASADLLLAARDRPSVQCRSAASIAERALHQRIRHEVFVREQSLFTDTDTDEHDTQQSTVHALGLCNSVAAGAVRFYPLAEPGLWKGDRLAVLPAFRSCGLGGPLVRFAVATATARGGDQMIAFVQPQNVPVFEHLGWRRSGALTDYVGQPHQKMAIPLS